MSEVFLGLLQPGKSIASLMAQLKEEAYALLKRVTPIPAPPGQEEEERDPRDLRRVLKLEDAIAAVEGILTPPDKPYSQMTPEEWNDAILEIVGLYADRQKNVDDIYLEMKSKLLGQDRARKLEERKYYRRQG